MCESHFIAVLAHSRDYRKEIAAGTHDYVSCKSCWQMQLAPARSRVCLRVQT